MANCILQFETVEERSEIIDKFISIAQVCWLQVWCGLCQCSSLSLSLQHCFELRNYGSVMAIVVAGLGSAPIRRLHQSWAGVQKERRDLFKEIDTILDSKVTKFMTMSTLAIFLQYISGVCSCDHA